MLRENNILYEIKCGYNFGYILNDSNNFVNTDYKVLQNQSNGIFIPCMKMIYNGKIELYYVTDDYKPMSMMFSGITPDILINIVVNMFESVVEVRNNGFLQSQNIDTSWDKIYVDPNTLKVKLVYLPINVKEFDSYTEFESELRSQIIKLINKVLTSSSDKLEKFVIDLANGSMSIDHICNKYKVASGIGSSQQQNRPQQVRNNGDNLLKLVAMNAPAYFEIPLNKSQIILGKKEGLVDVPIKYNDKISRKHCSIKISNGRCYLADEGSVNGTYVNKSRLIPHQYVEIKRGDIIRMANSDFQLV